MAPGVHSIVVLALYVILSPCVSGDDCLDYTEWSSWSRSRTTFSNFRGSQKCFTEFCCGECYNRYCCSNFFTSLNTVRTLSLPAAIAVVSIFSLAFTSLFIVICCCVCPCCCLYKRFHQPRFVIAATTHTTAATTTPQQYPQQPTAVPGPFQSSQGVPYQSVQAQPGYPAQPMPTSPYHGQPFTLGPPPSYLEATRPAYPPQPMPYTQAVFTSGQPAYPLKPLDQQQPNVPPASTDFLTQPAYNQDFVAPPP